MGTGCYFQMKKELLHAADHSLQSSAYIKNDSYSLSQLLCVFMACTGTTLSLILPVFPGSKV